MVKMSNQRGRRLLCFCLIVAVLSVMGDAPPSEESNDAALSPEPVTQDESDSQIEPVSDPESDGTPTDDQLPSDRNLLIGCQTPWPMQVGNTPISLCKACEQVSVYWPVPLFVRLTESFWICNIEPLKVSCNFKTASLGEHLSGYLCDRVAEVKDHMKYSNAVFNSYSLPEDVFAASPVAELDSKNKTVAASQWNDVTESLTTPSNLYTGMVRYKQQFHGNSTYDAPEARLTGVTSVRTFPEITYASDNTKQQLVIQYKEEVKSCAFPVGAPVVCYYSTRSKCAIGHFEMLARDDPAGRFKTLWLKAHTPGKIGVMDPKAVEAATTGGDLVSNNGQQGSGNNGQQGSGQQAGRRRAPNKYNGINNGRRRAPGMPSSLGQIANSLSLGRQMKQSSLLQESDGALSEEVLKAMNANTRRRKNEEVDLAPITPATVELKQDLSGLWNTDHISGLFCPGSPEAKASESATNKKHRTEGKEMALVAFSKLSKLQEHCDQFQKKVVRIASALPEDRKNFLSTSSITLSVKKGKALLYSPEGSAKEGETTMKISLTERLHLMEDQMKCRIKNQPLNCVQEGVLTFYERVVAMCDENVLIGDEIPSVATRGMTSGASSNNNKQECSPKDALFLLDVQFPGSYVEEVTECGGFEPIIVSSM